MFALAVAFASASCAERTTPDLRWAGPLTDPNPQTCPPKRGLALLRNGHITFTPDEGTWILTGEASPDGKVTAEKHRGGTGQNARRYETSLQARWTESTLTGTYTTPRCNYAVALSRQ